MRYMEYLTAINQKHLKNPIFKIFPHYNFSCVTLYIIKKEKNPVQENPILKP